MTYITCRPVEIERGLLLPARAQLEERKYHHGMVVLVVTGQSEHWGMTVVISSCTINNLLTAGILRCLGRSENHGSV